MYWYREGHNTLNADLISGGVVGLFYDSCSKLRHIAHYEPYKMCPTKSLCTEAINFSATASQDRMCPKCLLVVHGLIK
jgi:hypothetical protein